MIYCSVQPDQPYFHWQVRVYIDNFLKVGVTPSQIHVVWIWTGQPHLKSLELQKDFPQVQMHWFEDLRHDRSYIPNIKPYGMWKLTERFPTLNLEPIFYHDSDIIFLKKPDEEYLAKGPTWFLSDTVSYIGAKYCRSKGDAQFKAMCATVGVDWRTVVDREARSGGAQYVVKGTGPAYWYKVYWDCIPLLKVMQHWSSQYQQEDPAHHPIQAWTAEMWSTLWGAWFWGFETEVVPELDFSFATDSIEKAKRLPIMHNAGVTGPHNGHFFKGNWTSTCPIFCEDDFKSVAPTTSSRLYVDAILWSREKWKKNP
jgi:hypothetical protein